MARSELIIQPGVPRRTLGASEWLATRCARGLGLADALGSEGELLAVAFDEFGSLLLEAGWRLGEVIGDLLVVGVDIRVNDGLAVGGLVEGLGRLKVPGLHWLCAGPEGRLHGGGPLELVG